MRLDLFHHKSTAWLPGELWVTTSCPVCKQGVQGVCSVLLSMLCAASRHNMPWLWAAFSLHMAWPAWHLQLQRGNDTSALRANPDTTVPLLAKHLVGLSESPSHPGDDYPTRHCSLSPSPPSCHANKSDSVKGHGFLSRICARLLPPPHCLLPVFPLLPVLMLLGHWNKGVGLLFLMGTAGFWEAHRVPYLIRSSYRGMGRDCCFSPRHFIN